ncbi:alpha/beta fold hydrolase [Streptomyces sp. NRRL S-87]|uniref:alpha/beta fold hydrolase n=1 Tax=Streptomyces sp. NRRL S-87 TaxID=1463920 RepID=UPI0004C0B68D|nr:alpha/beta hydrolase [Streptomyces sp. NRRL S-87]
MPVATVGTARIPYRVIGQGPALVLVHGTGPGSMMWDHLIDAFADRHTVVLPELSGSQTAEDDGGALTVDLIAGQVEAVIEDAGLGPADVMGFSLGAPLAVAVAARRPDLVRRLVAVAGWSHPDDEYLRNMMTVWLQIADNPEAFGRYATLTAFSRGYLQGIGREAVELNTTFMRPTPGVLRQIDLNLRLDVRDLLPLVRAETLVIGCAQDATIPVANHRELHAGIRGSEYAEFDTGHIVVFEQAEEFTKVVRDFLTV